MTSPGDPADDLVPRPDRAPAEPPRPDAQGGAYAGGTIRVMHVSGPAAVAVGVVAVAAGAAVLAVGLTLLAGAAVVGTAVGGGMLAYRALTGRGGRASPQLPPRPARHGLDPSLEIQPGEPPRGRIEPPREAP